MSDQRLVAATLQLPADPPLGDTWTQPEVNDFIQKLCRP